MFTLANITFHSLKQGFKKEYNDKYIMFASTKQKEAFASARLRRTPLHFWSTSGTRILPINMIKSS